MFINQIVNLIIPFTFDKSNTKNRVEGKVV